MIQGGGIRGPIQVEQGGTIDIEVSPNDTEVEVSEAGVGDPTTYPIGPGKDAHIPVPNVPEGTLIYITIGTGTRTRVIVVEVVAPE